MLTEHAPGGPGPTNQDHEVHYYDESRILVRRVADFLAPGIVGGEAVVMIATPKHADLIELELRARGIDLDRARETGSFVALDAVATLKQFMEGDRPDQKRFAGVIGTTIDRTRSQATVPAVRAFGEMVAVLWAQGRPKAALALEDLWNDLLGHHPFSLMCGYPAPTLGPEDRSSISERHTAAFAAAD